MDRQQGPTVEHRNYIQYPEINHNGKEYEKECVCTYMAEYIHIYMAEYITESPWYTPETNTIL